MRSEELVITHKHKRTHTFIFYTFFLYISRSSDVGCRGFHVIVGGSSCVLRFLRWFWVVLGLLGWLVGGCRCFWVTLGQTWANYGLWATSGPLCVPLRPACGSSFTRSYKRRRQSWRRCWGSVRGWVQHMAGTSGEHSGPLGPAPSGSGWWASVDVTAAGYSFSSSVVEPLTLMKQRSHSHAVGTGVDHQGSLVHRGQDTVGPVETELGPAGGSMTQQFLCLFWDFKTKNKLISSKAVIGRSTRKEDQGLRASAVWGLCSGCLTY